MDFLRQSDIFDPGSFPWPVTVIGAGGIGSAVLLGLAKLGVSDFTIFDDDDVEPHNLPNQLLYTEADIGSLKVDAAKVRLGELDPTITVTTHAKRVSEDDALYLAPEDRVKIW